MCGRQKSTKRSGRRNSRPRFRPLEKGAVGVPVENRIKMLRLVEKLAMESADTVSDLHGGGSPAAHRLTIMRESDLNARKNCAKRLAGIEES